MLFKLSLVALIALVSSVSCSLQGRVINGIDSDIKKYEFMVSLRNGAGHHFCGGTILTEIWILTAAHCVFGKLISELSIQYGTTVISADRNNVANVKRVIIHEDYKRLKIEDDIALLELEKPLVFVFERVGRVKTAVPLYEVPQNKNGAPGVLLGWGRKSKSGKTASILQELELKIYSDKDCKSVEKSYSTSKILCAGVDKGRKGVCYGDSGGPLLSKDSVQLGISVSDEGPCGTSSDIYTKVSYYTRWIANHLKFVVYL